MFPDSTVSQENGFHFFDNTAENHSYISIMKTLALTFCQQLVLVVRNLPASSLSSMVTTISSSAIKAKFHNEMGI